MQPLESHACHGGTLAVYEHASAALKCDMKFSIFLPPQAASTDVASVMFLSGLTCTHDNFTTKAAAYGHAAKAGLAIIAPDTSPRGDSVPDDADAYDFGKGAGFYLNATQAPWAEHYRMEEYITRELPALLADKFSLNPAKQGIMGHSMGGHGALTLYLKYPEIFTSCSAFSPIVAPSKVPWGKKAFSRYLGENRAAWKAYDACELVTKASDQTILIDQGLEDQFLEEQLKPELFEQACADAGQALTLRRHAGYDHSYYFIQSFIEDHIQHHGELLNRT
ncbi:MAG: S-formylglutathione hydrolase [Rickettsiales bacterium]|nr:S-formylglutathione hydrolase [Rickettsiales bacterium]